MTTTNNIGAQGVSWTVFGAECLTAVYDLRWMIILAVILIGTDFWWDFACTCIGAVIVALFIIGLHFGKG